MKKPTRRANMGWARDLLVATIGAILLQAGCEPGLNAPLGWKAPVPPMGPPLGPPEPPVARLRGDAIKAEGLPASRVDRQEH